MKHPHYLIPLADATLDISEWWRETTGMPGRVVTALFDMREEEDSYPAAYGANSYRHVPFTAHYATFIGLTVEDSEDIRFYDLEACRALAGRAGFDLSEQARAWEDAAGEEAAE